MKNHLKNYIQGNVNDSGEDYSPLGLGILHGHLDVVKLLLKAGAKPNHFQRSRSGVANGTAMGKYTANYYVLLIN